MAGDESTTPQTYEFRAEIQQLLDILIHSVYTSKDIFIRELISNASDALEKVRFAGVQGREIHEPDAPLEIRIQTREEEDRKILEISDSGIGMTADEIRANIGTIAHSGATAFLEKLRESDASSGEKAGAETGDGAAATTPDVSLIGRFGVGFYSVFMVAKRVRVTSRSATPSAAPVVWTSDGCGSYTVEELGEEQPRGTRIEVILEKEQERFADADVIRETIRRYSNFVPYPIQVDGERVNEVSALWREPPTQTEDAKYTEFFKFLTHDVEPPVLRLHLSADAPIQFSALLFVPKTNTELLGFGEGEVRVQLYVKRVLIDPENKDLLPKYLRFARGVVESEDLPLNISRETLQENSFMIRIRETLTRKLLDRMAEMAENEPDEYREFWRSYGRILKEGYVDLPNRERFQKLLRFESSALEDPEQLTSLAGYVERKKEGQKGIYYLAGPTREALERDPRLEMFRRKGVEVLHVHDLADEFVLGSVGSYEDLPVTSADQVKPEDLREIPDVAAGAEGADGSEEKDGDAADEDVDITPLVRRFCEILGERVTTVRPSERLVDSPACLVSDEGQMSGHVDKMMRMLHKDHSLPKRTLELNSRHALVRDLLRIVEADRQDPFVERACEQIFEGCMLADGYLEDPHRLVDRMQDILTDAAGLRARGTADADAE